MDPIYQDILSKIKSREQVIANPREVYKDEKIEVLKHNSRLSEESQIDSESLRDSSLPGTSPDWTSLTASLDLLAETEEGLLPQEARGNVIAPARTISRTMTYSGISVQHNKTKRGVKLNILLQTPEGRYDNTGLMLTAELKRSDRLREIKDYSMDTDAFKSLVRSYINSVSDLPKQEKEQFAMGRLHDRGLRASWYQNALAIGIFEGDIIKRVTLHLEDEEYQIEMDVALSSYQQPLYHSSGHYGEVVLVPTAPSLKTAQHRKIMGSK